MKKTDKKIQKKFDKKIQKIFQKEKNSKKKSSGIIRKKELGKKNCRTHGKRSWRSRCIETRWLPSNTDAWRRRRRPEWRPGCWWWERPPPWRGTPWTRRSSRPGSPSPSSRPRRHTRWRWGRRRWGRFCSCRTGRTIPWRTGPVSPKSSQEKTVIQNKYCENKK